MDSRGQTTFEYLLLVGGVVVLGVLVVYLLTTSVKSSATDVNKQLQQTTQSLSSATSTVNTKIQNAVK